MNHQEVLSTLNSLLPEVVQSGDAEGVLLKRAMRDEMSPAQLERLCQIFNAAKTVSVMNKYASDRGRAFTLVDSKDVLARYGDLRKEASSLRPVASPKRQASAYAMDRVPELVWSHENGEVSFQPSVKAASAVAEQTAFDLVLERRRAKEAAAELATQIEFLNEIRSNAVDDCTAKIAAFVQEHFSSPYTSPEKFDRIERDFLGLAVGDAQQKKAFLDLVAQASSDRLQTQVKRASKPSLFAVDHTGAAAGLVDAWNSLCLIPAAEELISTARAKQAASPSSVLAAQPDTASIDGEAEQASKVRNEKRRRMTPEQALADIDKSLPEEETAEDEASANKLNAAVWSMNDGVKAPGESSGHGKALADSADSAARRIMEMVGASSAKYPEKEQEMAKLLMGHTDQQIADKTERALYHDHAGTVLQELAHTDPVISKAEGSMVASLAETIMNAAPSIAKDKNMLRLVLREGVQYGAIPLHTLKELTDLERKLRPGSAPDKLPA